MARISSNSAWATELFKSLPCKYARTCKPSWSLSLSISQLVTIFGRRGLKNISAYRGLSGMRKFPQGSMEPMAHWMKRGNTRIYLSQWKSENYRSTMRCLYDDSPADGKKYWTYNWEGVSDNITREFCASQGTSLQTISTVSTVWKGGGILCLTCFGGGISLWYVGTIVLRDKTRTQILKVRCHHHSRK